MEYTELEVWSESRKLVKEVYQKIHSFPKSENFGLTIQIKRSSVSVPSNIAEGCGRQSSKETIHFLYISRGSLYELETQLYLANDLGYLNNETLFELLSQVKTCKRLINGFIKYFKNK